MEGRVRNALPRMGRRSFLLGSSAVGAGLALGACGLFGDDGPQRIAYGSEPSQFGELHLPDAPSPWPIVTVIHGGSWEDDVDLSIMDDVCTSLRGTGRAVWNVEYRRVGEIGGGYPGTLDDIAAAIDHLGPVAAEHPVDLDRMLLLGHSAGGTLALWAAGRSALPAGGPGSNPLVTAQAVVSLAGVPDLATCSVNNEVNGACTRFIGGTPAERPDRYEVASPAALLPLGVPQAIVQGRQDEVVPLSQPEGYATAAQAAGDSVSLDLLPGVDHFELIATDQPAWTRVLEQIDRLG
jgi:acetyl esterase/lipase